MYRIFSEIAFFAFLFATSITILLNTPTLTAYISELTFDFVNQYKVSDSYDRILQNQINL